MNIVNKIFKRMKLFQEIHLLSAALLQKDKFTRSRYRAINRLLLAKLKQYEGI